MNEEELKFLRFAYSKIEVSGKIAIQNMYQPNEPPESYKMWLCFFCSSHLAVFHCESCQKNLCIFCSKMCFQTSRIFCNEHHTSCACGNCACVFCRVFVVDKVCETCLEEKEESFVCKTCAEQTQSKDNKCVICSNHMDLITHLQNKKRKRKRKRSEESKFNNDDKDF